MTTNITLPRATVEQAYEALWYYHATEFGRDTPAGKAITAFHAALAQQAEPVGTRALIEECLAAFAEELAAWDIDPPLHHVKQAHDKCEAWLAALAQQAEPTDPGHDVDVLREHVRHLERRVRELHAQQAEPVEPVAVADRLAHHGIPMPGDPK